MDDEGRDTYVSQLKEVFDSCDTTGSQCLNEHELLSLCKKLHLVDHSNFLVINLIGQGGNEVKFEDFKNCFVALLSQTAPNEDETEERRESISNEENAEREVSPKFTLGRKKYGRRSRPASIAEGDGMSSPVLSRENSLEQSSPTLPLATKHSQKVESASPGKRPMSPSYPQQPPTKSGRLAGSGLASDGRRASSGHGSDGGFADSRVDNGINHQRSNSDDTNSCFESNPVQYLQQTWKKLGIGSDGYLIVEELALVCEHIGMEMPEEVIAQLFEKLDCDQDGRISFEEFLQGLFQHGEPQSCESSPVKTGATPAMSFKEASRDDQIATTSISGVFTCLDINKTGYADVSSILELWESLELPCSPCRLEDLGFNVKQKINLCDLTALLEEELINSATTPLGQLSLISYQNELNYLRVANEQIRTERNKLRVNIDEANARAALLAQEVDDNHAKLESALQGKLQLMEKKYQDQMRELIEELQQERETMVNQSSRVKQQLQSEMQVVRSEDTQLKNRLNILEQENCRLELELQEMTEKFLEAQKYNDGLQKELMIVPEMKERLADLESLRGEAQEHQHQTLVLENENYKRVNQELQDRIDELTLEMENHRQQNYLGDNGFDKGEVVNRTHSWLSDYDKMGAPNGYKRRGSGSSSEDNSEDESPPIGKVRRKHLLSDDRSSIEIEMEEKFGLADGANCVSSDLRKTNRPSKVDRLIRDLFVSNEEFNKRACTAEEARDRLELCNIRLKLKTKVLNRLAYDIAKTSVA